MTAITNERRAEIMQEILKERGRPFNDTLRSYVEEYYSRVIREQYSNYDENKEAVERMVSVSVEMLMDMFDMDFMAFYHLFGKWLRQA